MSVLAAAFVTSAGLFFVFTVSIFASDSAVPPKDVSKTAAHMIEAEEYKPVEDKNAFLHLMANMSESNFKKIKTWTGEYLIDESVFQGNSVSKKEVDGVLPIQSPRKTTITLSFSIDVSAEKKFFDYKEHGKGTRGSASKNQDESVTSVHYTSILSPENFVNFQPNHSYGVFEQFSNLQQDAGRVVFVEERKNSLPFQESVVTDPINFYRIGPRFLWDELRAYVKFMEIEDKIQEQGTHLSVDVQRGINLPSMVRVVFVTDSLANGKIIRTIYLDGNKQYNLVRFYDDIIDPNTKIISPHVICDTEYTTIDGIVVPSKIGLNYPNPEIGKPDTFRRVYSLNHSSLNKPLGRDIFTMKNLNLLDGDRVFDKIANTLQVVEGGELVNIRTGDAVGESQRIGSVRIAFIAAGVILIFIGLFRKWRENVVARKR